MAIDALIYIWTTKTSNCEFEYVEETPSHIKSLIESAVEWLNKNIVYNIIGSDQHYLRENAFFSGSVKVLFYLFCLISISYFIFLFFYFSSFEFKNYYYYFFIFFIFM